MIHTEGKRKFLIVSPNKDSQKRIQSVIEEHVSLSQIICAQDGADAVSKIQNDAPDILILESGIPKMDEFRVTHWVLKSKFANDIAIILLRDIPEDEQFVDEVVSAQVQFVNAVWGPEELNKSTVKALNFLSRKNPREFYMRFLITGDVLIKEGDKIDNVYLVKRGELSAVTKSNDDNLIFLGKILSGEFVGEMSYINGEPRSATVIAQSDCELIAIPVDILDSVLFTKPSWAKALMVTLSKRVKLANKKVSVK